MTPASILELAEMLAFRYGRDTDMQRLCAALKPLVERSCRPTLEQARGMAQQVGVTEEEAESWWNAREAVDWMRGTSGGGIIPIGKNHAADLKTFINSIRQSSFGNKPINGNGIHHERPKQDTVWSLKTTLEAINDEIRDIDSTVVGAWGELTPKRKEKRRELVERRKSVRTKLAGLGE